MSRESCHTCEVLKDLYWLKVNNLLLAARGTPCRPRLVQARRDDELQNLKEEALRLLRTLMRHSTACYGLTRDKAA